MKVFISADIEGICGTTVWSETHSYTEQGIAAPFVRQMSLEVAAAAEGALAAGAEEVVIKDSHGSAINIDLTLLPQDPRIKLIRGWTGHPYGMVWGIDNSFDAVMFVGYHAAAGRPGNPLSHTYTGKTNKVRLNGLICSEFLMFSWACALEGVPTVFLAGDDMLCSDSKREIYPELVTVATKSGLGGATVNKMPEVVVQEIREMAEKALRSPLPAPAELPKHFKLELNYNEHKDAVRASHYPGCTMVGDTGVCLESDDFFEILRSVSFIF